MIYRTSNNMMLSRASSGKLFAPITTYSTTHRARSAGVATLTFSSHGMRVGDYVSIGSVGGTGYNAWVLITGVTLTTISYACPGSDEGTTADTAGRAYNYAFYKNISVNSSMSMEDVQYKIDLLTKRSPVQILNIWFADGTYNWTGPLRIRGRRNFGAVNLQGNTFASSGVLQTNQAVILNFSGPEGVLFEDCSVGVVTKIKIIIASAAADGYGVRGTNCRLVYVGNSYIVGSSTNYGAGFSVDNSFGQGYYTYFSNTRYAVHARRSSFVLTQYCGTSGTSVGTAWRSDDASWISGGHTTYMTGYSTRDTYGTYNPPWLPNTYYALGTFVSRRLPAGVKFECTRAGTSGSSEPTWPTVGNTANDPDGSGVQWTGRTDNTVGRNSIGAW